MDFKIITDDNGIFDSEKEKLLFQPKNGNEQSDDSINVLSSRNKKEKVFGDYIQSSPMIFTRDGHNMWFADMFRGKSAFLILGGPSFQKVITSISPKYKKPYQILLNSPGVVTMSVNNSIRNFRTDLWVSNDAPSNFMKSIWLDPKIMKFCPVSNALNNIIDNESMSLIETTPSDCPNTWFFRRNDRFNPDTFMYEDTFNWGNHKDFGGKRSVMLIAIRMLYYLGIRNVFLLGCDFKMHPNYTYHFKQFRHESSIRSNNSTYESLKDRFQQLLPHFNKLNYNVYNCNPESKLETFDFIDLDDAINLALDEFPNIENENTEGLYDREYRIRQDKKRAKLD